jgi:hypothetical protein
MKIISLNPQIPVERLCEVAQAFEIYLTNECKTMRHVRIDANCHELHTTRSLTEKEKHTIFGIESAIINTL